MTRDPDARPRAPRACPWGRCRAPSSHTSHACPGSAARFGAALHTRQGVSENWSCSVGFSTQAPSPALMKALNRQALAAWYSLATSLDSWYTLGLVILDRSKLEGTCRKI